MSVVFFCVGAAKAGTSWLHRQLSQHPECHLRAIKELHYFSALEKGKLADELTKHRGFQSELLERLAASGKAPTEEQAARLADRGAWIDVLEAQKEDTSAYLAYLNAGRGQAKVVGDLTPAYALLPQERFQQLASLAPDVRFLFLVRDPVERLWSHVRMMAARRSIDGKISADRCAHVLNRTFAGAETQITARCDYASTLKRLAKAVPPTRLLVEVFEDMIHGSGFGRVCDFLGIKRATFDMSPVHEGQQLAMSPTQRRAASEWLAPQYAAVEQTLGQLPKRWTAGGF